MELQRVKTRRGTARSPHPRSDIIKRREKTEGEVFRFTPSVRVYMYIPPSSLFACLWHLFCLPSAPIPHPWVYRCEGKEERTEETADGVVHFLRRRAATRGQHRTKTPNCEAARGPRHQRPYPNLQSTCRQPRVHSPEEFYLPSTSSPNRPGAGPCRRHIDKK